MDKGAQRKKGQNGKSTTMKYKCIGPQRKKSHNGKRATMEKGPQQYH